MLIMTYGRDGAPVNDYEVENLYKVLKNNPSDMARRVTYSTANIFNRVRLGIAKDEIDHQEVVFVFSGESMIIDKYGMIPTWVKGFLDKAEYCGQLLAASTIKRRNDRAQLERGNK